MDTIDLVSNQVVNSKIVAPNLSDLGEVLPILCFAVGMIELLFYLFLLVGLHFILYLFTASRNAALVYGLLAAFPVLLILLAFPVKETNKSFGRVPLVFTIMIFLLLIGSVCCFLYMGVPLAFLTYLHMIPL